MSFTVDFNLELFVCEMLFLFLTTNYHFPETSVKMKIWSLNL